MRNNIVSSLLGFSLIALLTGLPLIFIELYFSGNWYAIGHGYSLAMLFGITSYCLFCCTLVLSTRVRFLDKLFGHDGILRFHGYLSAGALVTGVIHCIIKAGYIESFSLQVVPGIASLAVGIIIAIITLIYMTAGLLAVVPLFARMRNFVSERVPLDYSAAKLFHNLFSLATALLVLHVVIASSTQESFLRASCIVVLGGVALLRYSYHKLLRPIVNNTRNFHLAAIEKPASNIVRLTFSSKSENTLTFLPGQFAYLRIKVPETGSEEHPFSFSSAPESRCLQMTIKTIGDYTSTLVNLKEGTQVILDGPYGIFTPVADDRNKIFIAGGIGITPLLSVLSSWQTLQKAPKTILFWSAGNEEDLIDRMLFERMEKACPWFSYVPMLTQESSSRCRHGRITPELITGSGALDNRMKTDFYLCGPPHMIRDLVHFLRTSGVPKRNIHYELFAF